MTHSKIKQKCFFGNSFIPLNQGDDTWVLKFPCVQKINIRSAKAKCDIAHHSRRKIKIELLLPIWKIYHHQCDCRCRAVGAGGGHCNPHILADQLTLSQPGGQIIPTTLLLAPPIFRPSYGPGMVGYLYWLPSTVQCRFFFQFDSFSRCEFKVQAQFPKSGLYFCSFFRKFVHS